VADHDAGRDRSGVRSFPGDLRVKADLYQNAGSDRAALLWKDLQNTELGKDSFLSCWRAERSSLGGKAERQGKTCLEGGGDDWVFCVRRTRSPGG